MIVRFDNLISAFVTTSSFKTSLRTYNLIRALASTLDANFSMETYRKLHCTIWHFISRNVFLHSFCSIFKLIRKFLLSKTNKTLFALFYRRHVLSRICRSENGPQSAVLQMAMTYTALIRIHDVSNCTIDMNKSLSINPIHTPSSKTRSNLYKKTFYARRSVGSNT